MKNMFDKAGIAMKKEKITGGKTRKTTRNPANGDKAPKLVSTQTGTETVFYPEKGDTPLPKKDSASGGEYRKSTWFEFQNYGLLLFVNLFLHIFGWAIVIAKDDSGNVVSVYPARTKFRGFPEESMTKAYIKLSEYISKNHKKLLAEAKDDG